jgi:hypothetical protein
MTSAAQVSIANRSLLSIGARAQIGSFNENSTEANAINTLFAPTFESLARSANWNCLRQQATLTLLAAAAGTPENEDGTTLPLPPTPYLYMYSVPSDSLQVRYLLPTFEDNGSGSTPQTTASLTASATFYGMGQIQFEVAYSKDAQSNPLAVILTNQSQAQVVYTINQPNPVTWDSLFQAAMVASLAAYLVPALSLNLPLMDRSVKAAEALIAQARSRDGNEGVTSQNRQADWINARRSGGGVGWNERNALTMYGYGGMIWPTG